MPGSLRRDTKSTVDRDAPRATDMPPPAAWRKRFNAYEQRRAFVDVSGNGAEHVMSVTEGGPCPSCPPCLPPHIPTIGGGGPELGGRERM